MINKCDIPFYEECKFGYYEWFAKKDNNEITIYKVATLAPFRIPLSDSSYKLDIEYLPELKNPEKFLNRDEAYKLVNEYWKANKHEKHMKIKVQ